MEKLTQNFIYASWENINSVIHKLRTMIRNEVKEKGEYIIPKDDEMLSPTICYNGGRHPEYASNAHSCVEKLEWSEEHNDVIIHCEDGAQYLNDCGMDDVFNIAETLAHFNEYGYHEDDEDNDE